MGGGGAHGVSSPLFLETLRAHSPRVANERQKRAKHRLSLPPPVMLITAPGGDVDLSRPLLLLLPPRQAQVCLFPPSVAASYTAGAAADRDKRVGGVETEE